MVEYQPLAEEAFASLKNVGNKWTHEKIEASEDIVKKFTKGKMTLVRCLYSDYISLKALKLRVAFK